MVGHLYKTEPMIASYCLCWLPQFPVIRMVVAAVLTVAFASVARLVRGVSVSGSIAGAIVAFLLYSSGGPGAFAALVSVFVLTWIATRFGYRRKQRLGTAENDQGRKASQVLANLATAAGFSVAFAFTGKSACLLAAAAALSEAAADTVSSELGQAREGSARLITTFEIVPTGTDGGITLIGTVAGIVAAELVAAVCLLTRVVPAHWFWIALVAGSAGMIFDSILGATLERRRWLNNDGVNFLGTLFAAGLAILLT